MNQAQLAPDVMPADWETVAFTAARALFAANQVARATEIYNSLAAAQWPIEDRAAALLDLEAHLRAVNRAEAADSANTRLVGLGATRQQLLTAQQFLQSLG